MANVRVIDPSVDDVDLSEAIILIGECAGLCATNAAAEALVIERDAQRGGGAVRDICGI